MGCATPRQAADITQAEPMLEHVDADAVLADKGYDSNALVERLEAGGIAGVIPPNSNCIEPRKADFALYRERNPVKQFFGKVKQFRGIATRSARLRADPSDWNTPRARPRGTWRRTS